MIDGLVRRFRALGLDVAITELDVPVLPGLEPGSARDAGLRRQADIYRRVVGECVAAGCKEITEISRPADGSYGKPSAS